ncbi:MAG: hypothetical protein ABJC19_05550 [Gemmatimonadota bacterium]
MQDRRYDRAGEFAAIDQVVRVRRYQLPDGTCREVLGWKGSTSVSPDGYKLREEVESELSGGAPASLLLERLGFAECHAIDRYVEVFDVEGAMVRLEWYPDADTLVEVEGDGRAIERAVAATLLDRDSFSAESLVCFAQRFRDRTGRPARLALTDSAECPPHWPR